MFLGSTDDLMILPQIMYSTGEGTGKEGKESRKGVSFALGVIK